MFHKLLKTFLLQKRFSYLKDAIDLYSQNHTNSEIEVLQINKFNVMWRQHIQQFFYDF